MSLFAIAWKSIRQRSLASFLTAMSIALGVALMIAVLVINRVVGTMFHQSATGYHLVVGAKGSPLQLVMNTIYHVSVPVENIPYLYYKDLAKRPEIKHALPMAMGDSTQEGSFRIVGTIPEFFDVPYMPNTMFRVRGKQDGTVPGRFLVRNHDAVIGSEVARINGWDVGHEFFPVHGVGATSHVHEEDKFTVVGVLARTGTPNDKVVFIHLEGFLAIEGHEKPADQAAAKRQAFAAAAGQALPDPAATPPAPAATDHHAADDHGHEGHDHAHHHHAIPDEQKEVTAVLVQTIHPNLTMLLQAEINEGPYAQAANPIREISWVVTNLVGNVQLVLVVMTGLIIAVSGIGVFVSIYNSMSDRRREIAIMRALGARRETVFAIILFESILLCLLGGLVGAALGHGLVFAAMPIVEMQTGLIMDPLAYDQYELLILPALLGVAILAGIIPGWTAYRTDVAASLGG